MSDLSAMGLRLQLEALLKDFPARTADGWWAFDCDSTEYKRGAMEDEAFWRTQIRRALDATTDTAHDGFDHCTSCQAVHQAKGAGDGVSAT